MLFNSIEFGIFLPLVFAIYWLLKRMGLKAQNVFLLLASYLFYGWWDWRFLSLIVFSSVIDFLVGRSLQASEDQGKRKALLTLSILVNLGFLGFFKYFNFFVDNFQEAFTFFGSRLDAPSLNIVLPVGISFYTFQTLSYSIDVYRRKIKATDDLVAFFAFVSFFPQLVAGPIERASNLLPQFERERQFDREKAVDGLRQMLWGFFKKIVIADNCAVYANDVFANYADMSGSSLVLGAVFFAFQIYGDFSGYSDIAIGTARLFGFNLMQNFAFPYFSRNIAEFWRRWHISLSTWFRDYLYIPLGGSRVGKLLKVRNILIIFLVSGFWHGANWTFIIWGLINALLFLPLLLTERNRQYLDVPSEGRLFVRLSDLLKILGTFTVTVLAWIFFRSESVVDAFAYLQGIASPSLASVPYKLTAPTLRTLIFVGMLLFFEWIHRDRQHALELKPGEYNRVIRWASYYAIVLIIIFFGGNQQEFIYFQF